MQLFIAISNLKSNWVSTFQGNEETIQETTKTGINIKGHQLEGVALS